jgi:exopolysaccharide biosynthesis polyprenyl glycosylphosphotransferase
MPSHQNVVPQTHVVPIAGSTLNGDLDQSFGPGALRFKTNALSASPSLLSPAIAWALLDFVVAYCLTALVDLAGHQSSLALLHTIRLHEGLLAPLSAIPFAVRAIACSAIFGLYKIDEQRTKATELRLIAQSVLLAAFALCGLQAIWHVATQPPATLVLDAVSVGLAMFSSRMLWRWHRHNVRRQGVVQKNFVIIGADQVGREVRDYLTSSRTPRYRFKGFISMCEPDEDKTGIAEDQMAGVIHDAIAVAQSLFAEEIIFSRRPTTPEVLNRILQQARSVNIGIRLIPSLTETLNNRNDIQYIGNLPTISIFQGRHHWLVLLLKRAIDITGAALAGMLLLPALVAIAIAIKLQSPGPVFYLSQRVGYKGRVFTCYKFRTMVQNAAALQSQIAHLNEREAVLFKISNDPRVTSVGAFLRKYSLDELPQLWNVFRGDMSLVGPRPSISSEVAQYQPAHLRRLDVVPGITGLWQVEARQDPSFESYIRLDSKYVNDWSLWLDLKILLRTVGAVITGTGS